MSLTPAHYIAIDLGAESGRVMVGQFDGKQLSLAEVHRFWNGPVRVGDSLHWDVLRLWSDIQQGISLAARQYGDSLHSIGLATWGVDFALLDAQDHLLGNPYHYRDRRTDGMMDVAFARVPCAEIFERTGIQFMSLNSLYQLLAMAHSHSPMLTHARTFLTMPDLFNFWLSGRKVNEFTNATTTQCYDPRAHDWARDLLARLDIPTHIFGEIVPAGTTLDGVRSAIAEETNCPRLPIIAPATHDTGSAVAATPLRDANAIYLSSGTWSLMGVEVGEPVINETCLAYNFTNEGGVNNTFRLLKNIMGLWLAQECRRVWASAGKAYSYAELTQMAQAAQPFTAFVAPSDERFLSPGDMPTRIRDFCRETHQPMPESEGALTRCIFESLALEYRWVAERLDELVGRRHHTVHIIGGGSQNALLNQLTANATRRVVVAGPVEATALGNVLVQAMTLGHITSLSEGRAIVRDSFAVQTYEPQNTAAWDEAYARYLTLRP
jgi:rhamnulokinase